MNRTKTIILENKKHKIVIESAKEGYNIVRTFVNNTGCFATVSAHDWAILSERYWFFGWHWKDVRFTNARMEAERWIEEYFNKNK